MILINYINSDGDGGVAPLDVLVVINFINIQQQDPTGEGESVTTATATSAIEIPVMPARFAWPAMEAHWGDAEVSASASPVDQVDDGLPGVWSTPDAWTEALPERVLVIRARDREQLVELNLDLLEIDSLLDDIALDIARSWNPST